MGEVVNLLDHKPHNSGTCLCIHCKHEWIGITPVGVWEGLECPQCGTMKGVLKLAVEPESLWVCGCGCHLFTLSGISGKLICWKCGERQEVAYD
jgi:hypothetical protein